MAYPTAAEIRTAVEALNDAGKFPDATLTALVSEFADIAERYRGVAFVSRAAVTYTVTTLVPTKEIGTPFTQVTAVAITLDGVTLASTEYVWSSTGRIVFDATIGSNVVIVVTYTHGIATTPAPITRACREYVRSCALTDRSDIPRDVIAQSFDGGFTRYSTPDWNAGRPTGWLEVDRLLNSQTDYRVPGFA